MATQASNSGLKEDYKTFMGARVLWPPEVSDEILASAIDET
jgi:hypothetical protein